MLCPEVKKKKKIEKLNGRQRFQFKYFILMDVRCTRINIRSYKDLLQRLKENNIDQRSKSVE